MKRIFSPILWWFLYTHFGQWLSMEISGGWCYIKKDDPRFFVTNDAHFRKYEGDAKAAPDRGISTQRNQWTKWVFATAKVIHKGERFPSTWHLAIDTHDGRRLACLGRSLQSGAYVRFSAGHESGMAHAISRQAEYQLTIIEEKRGNEDTKPDDVLDRSTIL